MHQSALPARHHGASLGSGASNGDEEDPSTADLLHGFISRFEQLAWMVSAENRTPSAERMLSELATTGMTSWVIEPGQATNRVGRLDS